jgi:pyruvate/2-oxoglutarate dehydrogenase complex dihydrolipoamide dehydrogenase (E3) component
VAPDERGYIQVDEQLRTNMPCIWAIGDCNGRGAFTHTSYNDYEIVAANLFDGDNRRVSDRITAYGLFIDPPLGRAGMTEAEVRKAGSKALVATYPMSLIGRARERGETEGFMKVLVDAESRKILGVGILGIGGDEVVHAFLDVMYAGAPFTVIIAGHAYPPDRGGIYADAARKPRAAGVAEAAQSFDHVNNHRWDELLKAVAPNVHQERARRPLAWW